jgi:2-iminobutanoate/2-iminopropanoate deaminase
MSKISKLIRFNSKRGPKAIGPYSTATVYRGVMYVSGQIGVDPVTGELVGQDVDSQTKRTMDNLKIVMEEAELDMSRIIKTTIYLKVWVWLCRT